MAWHKICKWNISDCPRNPWWDDAAWLDVAPCWHLPRNPQNSSESPWALYPWGKQANTKKKGGALETAKQQRRFQDQARSHNQNLNYIHQKNTAADIWDKLEGSWRGYSPSIVGILAKRILQFLCHLVQAPNALEEQEGENWPCNWRSREDDDIPYKNQLRVSTVHAAKAKWNSIL